MWSHDPSKSDHVSTNTSKQIMNNLIEFLRSATGRTLRSLLGLILIWWGFLAGAGWFVGLIGLIAFFAGIFNYCLLAPLAGRTILGERRVS